MRTHVGLHGIQLLEGVRELLAFEASHLWSSNFFFSLAFIRLPSFQAFFLLGLWLCERLPKNDGKDSLGYEGGRIVHNRRTSP